MSKGLILITGVNGFIAARCAKHFLDQGYSVRGTVRKMASAVPLLERALSEYAKRGQFEVVEVPDITTLGAFDEAVKNVTAIAHLASPVSFAFTDPGPVLEAAVKGTTTVLDSALRAGPQLTTVVLMSSIAAIKTQDPPPYTFTERDWNNFAEAEVARLGKATPGPIIYAASKAASEKAFWKFRDENTPSFAMTAVNPVFVIGPPLIPPTSTSAIPGTIMPIWTVFSGALPPKPVGFLPQVVDVRDVAALFLYTIEHPHEANGERYIASSAASHPQAVADILRHAMPETRDRIREGTPGQGYLPTYEVDEQKATKVDSSKARNALGRDLIGLENSVIDTAESFKGLL